MRSEDAIQIRGGVDLSNWLEEYPSPLLMTLLEHLEVGIGIRSFPAIHITAATTLLAD